MLIESATSGTGGGNAFWAPNKRYVRQPDTRQRH